MRFMVLEFSVIMKHRRSDMLSNPSPFATLHSEPARDSAVAINEMCEHAFVGMTVSQATESTVISISCHSGSLTPLMGLLCIGVRMCNLPP